MEHSGAKSIVTVSPLVHRVQEAGVKVFLMVQYMKDLEFFSSPEPKAAGKLTV